MGFLRSIFHYYTQITPLENVGHIDWMDYKEKIRNLHETTGAMCFMMSLLNYYIQITPLENGGHTVWMDYKQKILNLHETTEPMGFKSSLFHFYTLQAFSSLFIIWLLQIVSSHFKSDFFCKYGIARLLVKIMCLLDFHRICFLNLDVKWNHWAPETAAGSPVPRW